MAYKIFYLDERKKDRLLASWQGSGYQNFTASYGGEKLSLPNGLDFKSGCSAALPDKSEIEFKASPHFLFRGLNVLKAGQLLLGSALHPNKMLNIGFALLFFFGLGNLLFGLGGVISGEYISKPYFIYTDYYYITIEGLILTALAFLFKVDKSKLAFIFGSAFIFFDLVMGLRIMFLDGYLSSVLVITTNLAYIFLIVSLFEIYRYFVKLNLAVKELTAASWLKDFFIILLSFSVIYGGFSYLSHYSFFYQNLTTSAEFYNVGGEDGYSDAVKGKAVCASCVLPNKKFKDDYLDGYYQGYYEGCLEAGVGCEKNLPEDALKRIRGYETEDAEDLS